MNKFIITILLVLCAFITPRTISAHILKTDGQIGGILHIDPDDDPIAGQASNLFWDFTNKGQKFNVNNCTCYVSILESGKEIAREQLINETFTYTFPKKDVYQVNVSGNPRVNNSFQPFILSYDIRVSRETTNVVPLGSFNLTSWDLFGGLIMFLGVVAACIFFLTVYLKKER